MQLIAKMSWVSQEFQSFGQHRKCHGLKDSIPLGLSGSLSKRNGWQILASLIWIPEIIIPVKWIQFAKIAKIPFYRMYIQDLGFVLKIT